MKENCKIKEKTANVNLSIVAFDRHAKDAVCFIASGFIHVWIEPRILRELNRKKKGRNQALK